MSYGIVYYWFCEKTNMGYVGKTTNTMYGRWKGHLNSAFHPKSRTGHWEFPKAIREHGKESFIGTVLCECESAEELALMENHWMKSKNSLWPNGYNMRDASGFVCDQTRQLISERTKKAMANLDVSWKSRQREAMKDPEVKKLISERTKVAMRRPEVIANTEAGWSDRCAKISKTLNGHVVSEETRKKISEKLKSRPKKQRQIAACCSCRRQFTMTKKNQKYCSPKCYFERKKQ